MVRDVSASVVAGELVDRDALEDEVGLATLVHDADVPRVDAAQARVAATAAFVEQQAVRI